MLYNSFARLIKRKASAQSARIVRTLPVTQAVPFSLKLTQSFFVAAQSSQEVKMTDEWKTRPPYKIHDNDKNFNALYEGSCHCGRVQYQLSREKPLASKYCHCTTCQRLHGSLITDSVYFSAHDITGAPFQWAAIFHKEDINFTHGHHDLGWYDSGEKTTKHKLPCKVSCAYCRTPIMDEGRRMILLFPTLIKSDGDRKRFMENFAPTFVCDTDYTTSC